MFCATKHSYNNNSIITVVFVFVVTATIFVCGAQAKAIVLDGGNFDHLVVKAEKQPWLLEFYAPWCGHCKSLAPIYEIVSDELDKDGKIKVGNIDCEANKEICSRFEITGYPTIKQIYNGRVYNFTNHIRDVDSILSFAMNTHLTTSGDFLPDYYEEEGPSFVAPLEIENFVETTSSSGGGVGWLVEFYSPACSRCVNFNATYQKLAKHLEGSAVRVGAVNCDDEIVLCAEFKVVAYPKVVFVLGEDYWEFLGDTTTAKLLDFVERSYNDTRSYDVPILYGNYHYEIKTVRLSLNAVEELLIKNVFLSIGVAFVYGLFLGWYIFRAPVPPPLRNNYQTQLQQPINIVKPNTTQGSKRNEGKAQQKKNSKKT